MKLNKVFQIFFFCIVFFNAALSFGQEVYSKVNVKITEADVIGRLVALNFDIDHSERAPDGSIAFYVTSEELERLKVNSFSFEVIIPNYAEFYKENQALDRENLLNLTKPEKVANGFDLGSMGGFYTNSEVENKLDEMRTDFPNLITERESIGTTFEGNDIWMVKISDNPEISENEPAAYFDGLHHAREPLSMATNINFMFWLLEHYDTDSSVRYLIDNRELYFVPVVNPDGYLYNEQTNPNGGGFWRKNRNDNGGGGCFGVDLNRNYGYEFAHDGSCASNDPCSNIYHGTGPFSEAESIAVRDLLAQIQPNTAFSIHSTAGSYLMPYGFDTTPPAFDIYSEWASSFLDEAEYPYGVTFQMLGYTSCGTTRDYLHSEGIYGWTPEIGGSGFWPAQSTIFDLVDENVRPMLYQSWLAGAYLDVQDHKQIGDALPGESFELIVEIKNVGVGATSTNSSVMIQASAPEVQTSTAIAFGDIAPRSRQDNSASPFPIVIDPSFTGDSFTISIFTIQDGAVNETSEITIYIGEKDTLFFDDAENGASNWTATGNGIAWGTVLDDSYSGVACFGDSAGGNGENNTENFFELNEVFDLTTTILPLVSFNSKYSIEEDDLVEFQLSADGGLNWDTLESYVLNDKWNPHIIDLTAYKPFDAVTFRFTLDNDSGIPGDGFYFDDFEVSDYDNSVLGNPNNDTFSEVNVFPNPFEGNIIVDFKDGSFRDVKLFDINGRNLDVSFSRNSDKLLIEDLGRLLTGVYFLKLENQKGGSVIKKLIKL